MNRWLEVHLARVQNYGMNSQGGICDVNGARMQRFALNVNELPECIVRYDLRIETGMTSTMPSIRNKSSKSKRVQAMRSSSGRA